jgi:surface polysaccharide O-acyltransferase-like enzyme
MSRVVVAQVVERRPPWLTFAAVVMFAVGILRVITGIGYLAHSTKVANLSHGLFGSSVAWWGVWDLCIAALAFIAGSALLRGNIVGRVIGYVWAALVLIQSFLIMTYAPWFGFAALAISVMVIYAITFTGEYHDD